jgi:electron transport complex protein RnfD
MPNRVPQAFHRVTTLRFHLTFVACLIPVATAAVWDKGLSALLVIGFAMLSAWAADELLRWLRKVEEPRDWGAPLWGLLLALLLPASVPLYLPVVGAAVAVLGVKGLLGGGVPWINPVLVAWAFLQAGWPTAFDAKTAAPAQPSAFDVRWTDWLNSNVFSWINVQLPGGYLDLFSGWGRGPDALLVESGCLWLLAATVILLARGYIPWEVPTGFFLAFCVPIVVMGGNALQQVFSGSFLLCLFFLAPDPSTRPLGRAGLIVFAAGSGLVAFLIRTWGLAADGVGYAVLLMNWLVPWFDQRFRRKSLSDFRSA